MQSKTSFFNKTVFFKTMARFWPLWGAYLAIWIILMPIVLLANRESYLLDPVRAVQDVLSAGHSAGIVLGLIFAVLSAMAVWSFAYNTRSANGMAALPLRREGQFCSVVLAGIAPFLASNVIVFVLSLLAELSLGCLNASALLGWLALVSLAMLFFYGFATLCAQLTGNILVLPLVYGVLNFVAVAVESLLNIVLTLFVYGREETYGCATEFLSPAVMLFDRGRVVPDYVYHEATGYTETMNYHFEGWLMLGIYAAVGVLMLLGALLLFRRRRMETAGDVVAVNILKPVFRWCMALGCALCFGCLIYFVFFRYSYSAAYSQSTAFVGMVLCMLAGSFVGWFGAEMLIRKSFRIYRGKWGGWGICCVIVAALMLCTELDLFGYERWTPDPTAVESVTVQSYGEAVSLEAPENIAAAVAFHQDVIENKPIHDDPDYYGVYSTGNRSVMLVYYMENGSAVSRAYSLRYDGQDQEASADMQALQALLNSPEAIACRKRTRFVLSEDNIRYGSVSSTLTAAECAAAAGYDSAEDYVLCGILDYSPAEAAAMDEAVRTELINQAVIENAWNSWRFTGEDSYIYEEKYGYESTAADLRPTEVAAPEAPAEPIDLALVQFRYTWTFTPEELAALYWDCIVPDMEDATIGLVWIANGPTFDSSVYAAEISIDARQTLIMPTAQGEQEKQTQNQTFATTPTVGSARTNAWLAAHGVLMHTEAELNAD